MMLAVGQMAPDFSLESTQEKRLSPKNFRGKTLVLYFYPEDDTPGCTTQACEFRELHAEFVAADAVVVGISPDGMPSHERFRAKFGLPFILLADPGHKVAERYGAWGEKLNYGKKIIGMIRTTFIIDPQGRVAHIFPGVRTLGHAKRMLTAIKKP